MPDIPAWLSFSTAKFLDALSFNAAGHVLSQCSLAESPSCKVLSSVVPARYSLLQGFGILLVQHFGLQVVRLSSIDVPLCLYNRLKVVR